MLPCASKKYGAQGEHQVRPAGQNHAAGLLVHRLGYLCEYIFHLGFVVICHAVLILLGFYLCGDFPDALAIFAPSSTENSGSMEPICLALTF